MMLVVKRQVLLLVLTTAVVFFFVLSNAEVVARTETETGTEKNSNEFAIIIDKSITNKKNNDNNDDDDKVVRTKTMLNGLDMRDTIRSFFRACYDLDSFSAILNRKDKEQHLQQKNSTSSSTTASDKTAKIALKSPATKKEEEKKEKENKEEEKLLLEAIVRSLLDRKVTRLPSEFLDLVSSVCSPFSYSNSRYEDDDEIVNERLQAIKGFEHKLCGPIFSRSIRESRLVKSLRAALDDKNENNDDHNNSNKEKESKDDKTSSSQSQNQSQKTKSGEKSVLNLNECSIQLLNVFLLARKSQCHYDTFAQILSHYDCQASNTFSVKSNCDKCKKAYRRWTCDANVPRISNESGKRVKPCPKNCYAVQNLCPFFRPVDTYGGQPVFLCRDVFMASNEENEGKEKDECEHEDEDSEETEYEDDADDTDKEDKEDKKNEAQ